MKQGIYSDIKASDYHSDPCDSPSLSSSLAKLLVNKTPKHAFLSHPKLNEKYIPISDRKFDFGIAAHAVILEGKKLAVLNYENFRTKEARGKRDTALLNNEIPLLAEDAIKVLDMKIAFREFVGESEIAKQMRDGNPEQTIIWNEDGHPMRARLDWLSSNYGLIADYKTTQNSDPIDFINKKIMQMGHDFQACFYLRGLKKFSKANTDYVWIVQEIDAPYSCSIVGLGEEMKELGSQKVDHAIEIWKSCILSGEWPGYPSNIVWADPKPWAKYDFDDRIILHGGE